MTKSNFKKNHFSDIIIASS